MAATSVRASEPNRAATPEAPSTSNLRAHVGSGDVLDVRSFVVDERISGLYRIELEILSRDANLDFEAIVGHPARFELETPRRAQGAARVWSGLCRDLAQVAAEPGGASTYRLTLVPMMWLLTQRKNHRIFQQVSELDIARSILGEWGLDVVSEVASAPKPREYRVQYGETDYDFVCRMLEEAGIAFFFREASVVLTDGPQRAERRAEPIEYRDRPTQTDRDHVTKVRVAQRVRPGKVTMRDYDPRLPADYPLGASAAASGSGVEGRLEAFEYQPGALTFAGAPGAGSTPTADDRGTSRSDEHEGAALAQKRLEALRASRLSCTFETNAPDLGPGVVFSIVEHPRSELEAPLLVVRARHEGEANETWTHTMNAYRADVPFRPEIEHAKPKVSGVETATVVGPAGEEIHTDELGRVRVHFHWDRESKMDEKSSCWVHVSHAWGGAGYGGSNLPRIGQEVIVDFMSGDADKPMIVGRVYTLQQPTPYKLPDNKTQSGWKSCSTNQTGGYNEIMFEDMAGHELVRMQAEKDLNKLVKNDETVIIGHDRTKLVKHDDALKVEHDRQKRVDNDERVSIGHDRTELVEHDEQITIGHDRSELVQNDESVVIGRDRQKRVGKDDDLTIGSNKSKKVGKNEREVVAMSRTRLVGLMETVAVGINQAITVGKAQQVNVGKNQSLKVGGKQSISVGKICTETIKLAKMLTVGAAYQITVGGMMNTTVAKNQTEQVGKAKSVTAGDKISFTCGKSSLVMEKDGKITLAIEEGASVVLEGVEAHVTAGEGGTVFIQGGPDVHVNPPPPPADD